MLHNIRIYLVMQTDVKAVTIIALKNKSMLSALNQAKMLPVCHPLPTRYIFRKYQAHELWGMEYLDISHQHQLSGHSCVHQYHCEYSQQVVTPFQCSRGCLRISVLFLGQSRHSYRQWHLHEIISCYEVQSSRALLLSLQCKLTGKGTDKQHLQGTKN